MQIHKVLVLDDVNSVGELVDAAAVPLGLHWETITDISTVSRLLSEPSLILLDPTTPKLEGIELLTLLSELNSDADIVFMSSEERRIIQTAERLAAELGLSVAGHVHKPFAPTELQNILQKHVYRGLDPVDQQRECTDIDARELVDAIDRRQFVLHYKPVIDLVTGRVMGVEGYPRWEHPRRGLVFPDYFMGGISALGLQEEFDRQVIESGLSELAEFAGDAGNLIRLTLRVSTESLREPGFPETFLAIASKHSVPAHTCVIEVAGTRPSQEIDGAIGGLVKLRAQGVQVAITHYGLGQVGLKQVRNMYATELKIDQTLVQNMHWNDQDRVMVQKTVRIAHELNIKAIAEGVERQQQMDFLQQIGCDYAKGYLFACPLSRGQMKAWLRSYLPARNNRDIA